MVFRGHGLRREVRTDGGAEPLAVVEAEGADVVSCVGCGIRAGEGDPLSVEGEFQLPPGLTDTHGLQPGGGQRHLAGPGPFGRSPAGGADVHFRSALLQGTSPREYYMLFGTNRQEKPACAGFSWGGRWSLTQPCPI